MRKQRERFVKIRNAENKVHSRKQLFFTINLRSPGCLICDLVNKANGLKTGKKNVKVFSDKKTHLKAI
jgi:hypothetical protein